MTAVPDNLILSLPSMLLPAQIITLLYYLASYFPGGATGVQYLVGGMGKGVFSLGAAAARSAFSR